MEIVSAVAGKIAEYLFDGSVRHFCYLLHCNDNIQTLRKEAEKLEHRRNSVQARIDIATNNNEIIEVGAQKWIEDAATISKEAEKFLDDDAKANKRCFNGWCINLCSRYKFSKEAKGKAESISQLHGEGNFQSVSHPAPPPPIVSSSKRSFESRKAIMKQIMTALDDDSVNKIGICGMGGVGKTTMVKEIGEQAKRNKQYTVVMAVVSQSPDLKKIQNEIAEMLGLKSLGDAVSTRAGQLWERIKRETQILVILDDAWKQLDLDSIGIPCGDDHEGCKVLITSRSEDVCNQMDAQRTFTVETLSQEESWVLFKETAGEVVDSSDINPIARKVAAKCGGLPIAILTLGGALKKKGKNVWVDALRQLQKSNPTNIIGGMQENVISSLELSYNYLESDEAKSFFLLCCLFPEDYDIPVELLTRYAVGLGLFKDVDTLDDARCRADAIVSVLSSSFLLMAKIAFTWEFNDFGEFNDLEGEKSRVKMHDVIRDVALKIASKNEHKFFVKAGIMLREWPRTVTSEDIKAISLMKNNIHELAGGLEYPNLQVLLMQSNSPLVFANNFFQGMKKIKVLDLAYTHLKSLPSSIAFLANLKTLRLDGCELNDISIIGEITNLEILTLYRSGIKEIPKNFDQLIHLRLFDVRDSYNLFLISECVISRFYRLEELYIGDSLLYYGPYSRNEKSELSVTSNNAMLLELQTLSQLTSLNISIPNPNILPHGLPFQNLTSFCIAIGKTRNSLHPSFSRHISLSHEMSIPLPSCLQNLIKRSESLELFGITGSRNILYDLDNEGLNELKSLSMVRCEETKNFLNTSGWKPHRFLCNLEQLGFHGNPDMVEICHGPLPPEFFSKMKMLEVNQCNKMFHIVPGHLIQRLQDLEDVTAFGCDSLKYVFDFEGLQIAREQTFLSSLKSVDIQRMPALTHIWKHYSHSVSLRNLKYIVVNNCEKLTELFPPALQHSLICLEDMMILRCHGLEEIFANREEEHEENERPVLKNDHTTTTLSLGNLTNIEIRYCGGLTNLFSRSIVKSLVLLKNLRVSWCKRMEEIVTHTQGEKGASTEKIMFRSLYSMELIDLKSLTCFCPALYTIEFSALENLEMYGCQKMKTFSNGDIVTPKLNKAYINGKRWTGNLNTIVQQLFDEKEMTDEEDVISFPRRVT